MLETTDTNAGLPMFMQFYPLSAASWAGVSPALSLLEMRVPLTSLSMSQRAVFTRPVAMFKITNQVQKQNDFIILQAAKCNAVAPSGTVSNMAELSN